MVGLSTYLLVVAVLAGCQIIQKQNKGPGNLSVEYLIAGEPATQSIILQAKPDSVSRLKAKSYNFELSLSPDFSNKISTPFRLIDSATDYIIKEKITSLKSGTTYFYRCVGNPDSRAKNMIYSRYGEFKTLREDDKTTRFVLSSCMHYEKFYFGKKMNGELEDTLIDRSQGFPALQPIINLQPDFWILNGDNVYYDHNYMPDKEWENRAKTRDEMRKKWHLLYQIPLLNQALASISTYWLKDDHDFRYDDADLTDQNVYPNKTFLMPQPTVADGIYVFREQTPVTYPVNSGVTYRTYQLGTSAQIWFLEGRDYRSPKTDAPSPQKTIWGQEQKAWLLKTLTESKAKYKFIVSPSPLVGPDENYKTDNHVTEKGYKAEADEFFNLLIKQNIDTARLFILCGDRHWQYHSIHPSGYHEFCSGALNDENSRLGIAPGEQKSSDALGLIRQPYTSPYPSGGFIYIETDKNHTKLTFYGDSAQIFHTHQVN